MAKPGKTKGIETVLTHSGRVPAEQHGFVNTPVVRGSTVLFATLDELQSGKQRYRYARTGNPSTASVEDIVTELEGAAGTVLAPSGLSAISIAFMSCLSAGDELLVTDSAYEPTRKICNGLLKRMGVITRFYDPRIGAGIADLISSRTRAVFVESPGSLTFDIQDLPAIANAAHAAGAIVIVDNTWATPLFFHPLALGADVVVHAGTKMFSGHSDISLGTISANEQAMAAIRDTHRQTGTCASPDDAFLAARGLRTLSLRMKEHSQRSVELARWLEKQAGVKTVLHPALESHPGNAVFTRDFSGSGSLFSVVLEPAPRTSIAAMADNMDLFGMGFSWGGYESLILPSDPGKSRTAVPWTESGNLIRLHIGFETLDDLKSDLSAGLERYRAANA